MQVVPLYVEFDIINLNVLSGGFLLLVGSCPHKQTNKMLKWSMWLPCDQSSVRKRSRKYRFSYVSLGRSQWQTLAVYAGQLKFCTVRVPYTSYIPISSTLIKFMWRYVSMIFSTFHRIYENVRRIVKKKKNTMSPHYICTFY